MNRVRSRLTVAAVAGALALGAAGVGVLEASSASATPSGGSSPKGNAGTIKINGAELAGNPRNVPHVGCDFTVAFYGYAAGAHTATLRFEGQAPTRASTGSDVVLEDSLTFQGGKGLDAYRAYRLDLSRFPVHPKQGVHVKLTVNAPGTKGADVKHKVFWVEPCTGGPSPSPSPTPTTPGPTPSPTTPAPTPSSTVPVPTPSSTTPAPTPSSTTPSVGNPQPSPSSTSSGGGGQCTGAAASSPDCTTVSTPPHFTG